MKYKYNGQWYNLTIKALDGMPLGSGIEYFGTLNNIPTGWLVRDGSAISRTEYSELFAIIGTTYGAGDGSTTFNLPNDCGRIDVGYDPSDTDFDTIGKTGGSKYLQEHNHYTTANAIGSGQDSDKPIALYNTNDLSYALYSANITATSYPTANAGTGDSGNLQPYLVCLKLIKAKNTTPTMASIVDAYNTSTTDGYSCNYANEHYEGVELWTNSNVTSDFNPTTINLNGTYSKLIIEFVADSSNEGKKVKSFKEILTGSTSINFKLESLYVGYFRLRDCSALNNQVYFGSAYYYTEVGGSPMSSNIQCIPTRIIGYK